MIRFLRFQVVGAFGIVVQQATLAVLIAGINYRAAAVLALGITLIHNFAWHLGWTWRDREVPVRSYPATFAKFVAANGLVSLAGAVALMPFLVESAGLHPLAANLLAIAACGIVNYGLAAHLCFVSGSFRTAARPRSRLREAG